MFVWRFVRTRYKYYFADKINAAHVLNFAVIIKQNY